MVVECAVAVIQTSRAIRSAEQHLEECPIRLVFGSESAVFRTTHNDLPFGRAKAPPPYTAALFQECFKDGKLIRHCDRSLVSWSCVVRSRSRFKGLRKNWDEIDNDRIVVLSPEWPLTRSLLENNLKLKTIGCNSSICYLWVRSRGRNGFTGRHNLNFIIYFKPTRA